MHALVVMPFEEKHKTYIEGIGKDLTFEYSSISAVTQEQVNGADIILGNAPAALVKNNDHLKWMQLNSAGADAYCKPGILKPGTYLTCATGAYGLSVSEWMLSATLMLCRKMDLYGRHQVEHLWKDEGRVTSVWGSTFLILGLGNIGGEYAKKIKALGGYCIGVRRSPSTELPEYLDELYTIDHLDELLPRADFAVMVLPGGKSTENLMNEERLALMKPGAYLINAGRGNALDEEALLKALTEGRLGGAALDVAKEEPLPADSPLWDAPRCIITPHVAGKFHLQETFERIVRIAGENMALFVDGKADSMRNIVDFSTGYRKR